MPHVGGPVPVLRRTVKHPQTIPAPARIFIIQTTPSTPVFSFLSISSSNADLGGGRSAFVTFIEL